MKAMGNQILKVIRRKDFELIEELGRGACGRTVLLNDPIIGERFVCKKYAPMYEELTDELYGNFVEEIKLLHLLNHPNIVRVFNYYLYPEEKTGYILMEHVLGSDIEDYLKSNPENINTIFSQAIEAFFHLETNDILHRDIRPMNILVSNEGGVKVIDFGFGKKITETRNFDKSISLNWWCEPPNEFKSNTYNHTTEVYFVGKLFENIILENQIEQFSYKNLVSRMVARDPENRISLFSEVRKEMFSGAFADIEFGPFELDAYRNFADQLTMVLSKVERSSKYIESPADIIRKLEECYKTIMLEEYAPTNSVVIKAFISGAYYYSTRSFFQVATIRRFLELLRHSSSAKRNIIVANLKTRLDSLERYDDQADFDDDIPF
jgi:serine/threonine protein kinase